VGVHVRAEDEPIHRGNEPEEAEKEQQHPIQPLSSCRRLYSGRPTTKTAIDATILLLRESVRGGATLTEAGEGVTMARAEKPPARSG